ncbi:MAG: hypothetical protein ACKO3N_05925 [Verrucomicrobiota bacterium]
MEDQEHPAGLDHEDGHREVDFLVEVRHAGSVTLDDRRERRNGFTHRRLASASGDGMLGR